MKIDKKTGKIILTLIYVDDILIACADKAVIEDLKKQIREKFSIKDLGEAKWILKIQVERRAEGTWIGQPNYITQMLKDFDMYDIPIGKVKDTPMTVNWKHDDTSKPLSTDRAVKFVEVSAKLLYLATQTRPDISFAVNTVAQYQRAPPRECDWEAVMRILRYLRGTINLGLFFPKSASPDIIVYETMEDSIEKIRGFNFPEGCEPVLYTDASYGEEPGRKSRSGYLFTVFGAPVIWYSKKQTTMALSSTEAEAGALVEGLKEAKWMKGFLSEVGFNVIKPMASQQDNQSVIAIAVNPIHHARIKHMEIKIHFIRECVENDLVKLVYCPTELMIADILTKALPGPVHRRLVEMMGMRILDDVKDGKTDITNLVVKPISKKRV
jgi:hypothetical protein